MLRGFKFGVVLTLLLAVLTVQIAPTVDLPETMLRDHRVVSSHSSGEHAPGGFSVVSSASHSQWRALEKEDRLSPETQPSDHARVSSSRVLRC
jgi:hypothetical protein